jgi:hypothetical protein
MVQTGMTTPYTAFAQQNGDHSGPLKPEMKAAADGGGGGGPPPNGVNQVLILPNSIFSNFTHTNMCTFFTNL